jgi:hypothetical protein
LPSESFLRKTILTIPADSLDKQNVEIVKKEPITIIGRIAFNHDAAGGKYDIFSKKMNYTIRYVWDLSDEQKSALIKIEESNQQVLLKGQIVRYKDGSKGIDRFSPVEIIGK